MQLKVAIIDYGVGNIHSVYNAFHALGYKTLVTSDRAEIERSDALILPGVGAFDRAMQNLQQNNLVEFLNEKVLVKKKHILGICLGMQLMAGESEENGLHKGFNWIPGRVKKLSLPPGFSVPHVGWNTLEHVPGEPLFSRCGKDPDFYFDHSYHFVCDARYAVARCSYGDTICASVRNENISGVQFHPEKSHRNGLKLFRSFCNYVGQC